VAAPVLAPVEVAAPVEVPVAAPVEPVAAPVEPVAAPVLAPVEVAAPVEVPVAAPVAPVAAPVEVAAPVAPVAAPAAPVAPVAAPVEVAAPVAVPVAAPINLQNGQKIVFPPGDYTTVPAEAGNACIGNIGNIGGKLFMKINTSILTDRSTILLTPLGRGPTLVAVSNVNAKDGQFTISAGSVCSVNWVIVN
jgi:hypothetical protein